MRKDALRGMLTALVQRLARAAKRFRWTALVMLSALVGGLILGAGLVTLRRHGATFALAYFLLSLPFFALAAVAWRKHWPR